MKTIDQNTNGPPGYHTMVVMEEEKMKRGTTEYRKLKGMQKTWMNTNLEHII